jgi:hypothetical protein
MTPIVEKKTAKSTSFDSLQKLLGYDLVRIDIRSSEWGNDAGVCAELSHH